MKRAKARLKARTEPSRALGSAQLSSPNSNSEKAQLSSARQIQFLKKLSSAQLAKLKLPAQLVFLSLRAEPKDSARQAHFISDFGEYTI